MQLWAYVILIKMRAQYILTGSYENEIYEC